MLFNVTLHDFAVESERLFLSELVGQLSLLWLHMVCLADTHDISETIFIAISHILCLLGQEALVLKRCIDLLAQTSGGRFVLGGIAVKTAHLLVEFVYLTFFTVLSHEIR